MEQQTSSGHFSEIQAQLKCGYDIYGSGGKAILLHCCVIKQLVNVTDTIASIAIESKSRNQNRRTTSNGAMKLDFKV